jgi:hypothetical protein
MQVKETTLSNLLKAIRKVGEHEVENILHKLQERDSLLIDEVVDMVCKKIDINKSFLFLNIRTKEKSNAIMAIVYILKNYDIATLDIQTYFSYPGMRVNEIKESFFQLSDNIPQEKELKQLIFTIDKEAEIIFLKYYFTKKINHGSIKS